MFERTEVTCSTDETRRAFPKKNYAENNFGDSQIQFTLLGVINYHLLVVDTILTCMSGIQ